ncbi:hypothetical protein AB0B83_27065 [Micromonospora sp. NPDC049060]|uniref:hypothetical protein n=1 Tax=Micromonospora sp. NPDC049060 TaxID=3154828 RepID=UPI0033CB72E3
MLFTHPAILGFGRPLFDDWDMPIELDLLEQRSFKHGVTMHHYAIREANSCWGRSRTAYWFTRANFSRATPSSCKAAPACCSSTRDCRGRQPRHPRRPRRHPAGAGVRHGERRRPPRRRGEH